MLFSADQIVRVDQRGTLIESLPVVSNAVSTKRLRTLGLCDIQLNGFAGIDFNNPELSPEDFHHSMQALLRTGVTNALPTLITASQEHLYRNFEALERARALSPLAQAMVKGYHLEGPFLNPAEGFAGCHPSRFMGKIPSWEIFADWQSVAGGRIKLLTVAPEMPGVLQLIPKCVESGVRVSLGHTNAPHEIVRKAVELGASLSTHLGNGVAQLLPKVDNPILSQLAEEKLSASFIADGFHQKPHVLGVYIKAKGSDRTILVSDGTSASGAPPGTYYLGTTKIQSKPEGVVHLFGTQNLAGSAATLLDCFQNVMNWYKIPLEQGICWASIQPRQLLGWPTTQNVGDIAEFLEWEYLDDQWILSSVQLGKQIIKAD
jgi:N-acetylglucosamine-6-phosphate deacetylase